MSLALELQLGRQAGQSLRAARFLLAAAGAGAVALAGLEWWRSDPSWSMLVGLVVSVLAAMLWRGPRWGAKPGILRVAEDGVLCWRADNSVAPDQEAELRRWQFTARFAWLELRTTAGDSLRLVLARSAFSGQQWAALGRWLTWVERDQRATGT